MIYFFLHCDEFLTTQRLAEIKRALGDPEMASINTTELNEKTSAGEILAQASAMPFLSERRLVIVRGFLVNLDKRMARQQESQQRGAYRGGQAAGRTSTCA
jgi:DNA polymerase III delta subunit